MASDKTGYQHAHKSTGAARSSHRSSSGTQKPSANTKTTAKPSSSTSPLPSPSPLPTPTPTQSPRRRPSNIGRHSSASVTQESSARTISSHHSSSARSKVASAPPAPESLSSKNRDSFHSILEDPFFQVYSPSIAETPDVLAPLQQTGRDISAASEGDAKGANARWPQPRRESLTIGSSQPLVLQQPPSAASLAMETFNVAVIGSAGVGKSSFIQKTLGLPRPPTVNVSSVRVVVDNTTHMITLLELDLEHFELSANQPIQWPKQIHGHIVPRVDAALILYDVMNSETLRELPQALAALTNSGLPSVLVANKCEHPRDEWAVDAEAMAKHKYFQACIATYQASTETPEVARSCLQTILRAAVTSRREENGETVSRRRAQSNLEAPDISQSRSVNDQKTHHRASSEFSLLRGFSNSPGPDHLRSQASKSPRQVSGALRAHPIPEKASPPKLTPTSGLRHDKTDSFLDVDESDAESHRYSDDIPILQRNDDNNSDKSTKAAGESFDELVDRLLTLRLSKADTNFSDIFLCLYRKFAAPGELFAAILARLGRVRDNKSAHYLTRTATQLRIIEVVAKWVALYPGDFARPATRRNLEEFIKHLSTEPIFAIAAQQMRRNLQYNVVEDDDTGWAHADEADDTLASQLLSKESGDLPAGVSAIRFDDDDSKSSVKSEPDKASNYQSQFAPNSYDDYERQAALLGPTDHLPMNKFRYHIFMDIPENDVADELTRIDWIMFSSIRIRDFVRHVSLSGAEKEKCKSLRNVNRTISHFNHIAQWVANMILLRDKAKHRAQVLEKFMNIATRLRQLNNYNGLAAVLAGINGVAISRLSQTRNLVPPEVHKRYAKLLILMGTQKSHFAYRLGWENSPLPRIPYIPLHRRDLVSAEEGNKTFVGPHGDRINWKKFEVLGDVLLPIMKSQGTAYPNLAKQDTVRELILGCRMPTDDEDIYQRSVQLESGTGPQDPSRKKTFPWFAK